MASSGSFNTSAYDGRYLTFSWSEKSQSIANNTTTISWTLKGAGGDSYTWYTSGNFKVVIAGETVYFSSTRIKLYNGTTVASGTYTFSHNGDGSKSFAVSAEAGIYAYAVNCSGSKTFTLDTIARKSTLSASNGILGTAQTLSVSRQASNLTHTITYKCGSASGTICTKSSATSYSWTPPLSLASQNTSGTSVSIVFTITTYSGSTNIGSSTRTISGAIPESVKPSLSVVIDDITGIDDIYGSPVKGLSKIKVTPTATTAYSSPIASYTIKANGVTYSTSTATTGFLTTSGSSIVSVTVKDKRGRSATWSKTLTVLNYTGPTVNSLIVKRCDQNGAENQQGEYVQVTFSAAISSVGSKNTAAYSLRYKKTTNTAWTTVGFSALNNKYTVTNHVYIFAADGNFSFDVQVTATDRHSTATRSTNVSTAYTLFNCHPSGTGFALGKISESINKFEVGMPMEVYGPIKHVVEGTNRTRTPIEVMPGDANGDGIKIEAAGRVVIGAGESATTVIGGSTSTNATEYLYLSSDQQIYCMTNLQNGYEERKTFTLNQNGNFYAPGDLYGQTNRKLMYRDEVRNQVLWTGQLYMTADHTATLSQAVAAQPYGIVLVFVTYYAANNEVHNYGWNCFFVPKYVVAQAPGMGHSFLMTEDISYIATKYLYISDTKITGYNDNSTVKTANGISYTNNRFVLRYVLGV